MPKRQINANDPLNSKLVMDRDSTSSRSNNYRSRRYDDTEPEPERVKAGEGNTRDKHNRSHTTEESKKPRTSSSRSKSPNCRWDDPMKLFSEKHKPEKPPKHRAPPNRFNIQPGRQWDGIDRSNGFEVAYFKKLAQQSVKKDLDYKYTVADM